VRIRDVRKGVSNSETGRWEEAEWTIPPSHPGTHGVYTAFLPFLLPGTLHAQIGASSGLGAACGTARRSRRGSGLSPV